MRTRILLGMALLLFSVTACSNTAETPATSPAKDSATATETEATATAEPTETDSEQAEPGQNYTYAEEYVIQSDPGEYLGAAESAELVFVEMRDNGNIPEYSDDLQYKVTLTDLTDVNGEECYVYRLDADEPSGTVGAAYAYAYQSGNIYMQGSGGQWVKP